MSKEEQLVQMKHSTNRFKKSKYEILKFKHTRDANTVQSFLDEWSVCENKNWFSRKFHLMKLQEELSMFVWGIILTIVLMVIMHQSYNQIMAIDIVSKYATIVSILIWCIVATPILFATYVFFSTEREFFYYANEAVANEQKSFEALREEIIRMRGEKK